MSWSRIFIIVGLFVLVLTGIRLAWVHYHAIPEHPKAVKGVLDLRNWQLPDDKAITLNGEWEFYPYVFIDPTIADSITFSKQKSFLNVPGYWDSAFQSSSDSPFEYGTYHLKIQLKELKSLAYGIRVPFIQTAFRLYVNGELLESLGTPSVELEGHKSRTIPYSAAFIPKTSEIDIVIQASNVHSLNRQGGIVQSIEFGSDAAVTGRTSTSRNMQLLLCVVLALHGLYAGLLYYLGRRQKVVFLFMLLVLCTIFSILLDDDHILPSLLQMNYDWTFKLILLAYIISSYFIIEFITEIFPEYKRIRGLRWFSIICIIGAIVCLIKPLDFLPAIVIPLFLISILPIYTVPFVMIHAIRKGNSDAIFLLIGSVGIAVNLTWGLIRNFSSLDLIYYPFDIIFAFLGYASYWFKHFFRNMGQSVTLAEKLQIADRLKNDFLMNTSHELRNPLHGMINIAQNVLDSEKTSMDAKNAKNMELLISVGRRMSFMLNDLLDLNRLHEKGISIQIKSVQLQSVVVGVLDMLRFMTEDKPIRFVQSIRDSFPKVQADENRIIQILFNLLHNAVKFTNEGSITISAEVIDGKAHIAIEDTGVGIDDELKSRIFQPYEQGDSSMTSMGGGLGLGLSICKQLIDLLDGTLKVRSVPGMGSTFTVILPLSNSTSLQENTLYTEAEGIAYLETAASTDSEPTFNKSSTARGDRPKILAVDDDPLNLKILNNVLSSEDYEVVLAKNGKDALDKLDSREWDLIIADVMMPHMSGYELSALIRERFSIAELPILLLTARSRPEDIYTGFLSGANDYVTKPMDALELKARVRALTNVKQSMAERLRMEGAWLQAQIQPHFLFNTLNSIAALSEIDTEEMRELLSVFGDYLRASFDFKNLERIVPLSHELELVRSYLYIEKVRFEDKLQVIWEIDERRELLIPPLSIQPLVENAVRHGILKRPDGGSVTIKIIHYGEYTEVSVTDTGVGMSGEKQSQLLNPVSDKRKGVGLYNTDRRLKQIYGTGLSIKSTLDAGTTISFRIPFLIFN